MDTENVTIKVRNETRKLLRIISAFEGKSMMDALNDMCIEKLEALGIKVEVERSKDE